MKKMLSMALALLLLAVPLLTASAYGWSDGLFLLPDLEISLAVPGGATVSTDEQLAAINADPSNAPTDPVAILYIAASEQDITFMVGVRNYAEEEDFNSYVTTYVAALLAQGGNPNDLELTESDFFGRPARQISYRIGNIGILSHLISRESSIYAVPLYAPTESYASYLLPREADVYAVLIFAPIESHADGSVTAFLSEVVAPMRNQ